jgi:hypothetical protein
MPSPDAALDSPLPAPIDAAFEAECAHRARRHPLSRWYLIPFIERLATLLAPTPLAPLHVTLLGLACTALAVHGLLVLHLPSVAALGTWLAWSCDRLDGALARRQRSATAFGAWFDANVDELADVVVHAAVAGYAQSLTASALPVWWFALFVAGKFLLHHGLDSEPRPTRTESASASSASLLRTLYHAPANADVRVHFLIACLVLDQPLPALIMPAVYYSLRSLARFVLVARRARPTTDRP